MTAIELDPTGIRIDGEPRRLLCASLFYFRLPREEWRDRLRQVRRSGYTCIDVYFPWNFHETAPGEWCFEGRRDLAAFLDLAAEEGLYVVARPGPYICSEWDGGGLPAWLGLDNQLGVRQHEPRYLAQVDGWFARVLPILAERQHPGGPVIMVQLENELDFFDCHDRSGYLTALRDRARAYGISVPLIACAGQGDLPGATGDVPGIVPACNFYPRDDSPDIETDVRHYASLLAARGLPLLVTETNRKHTTLRRLLASGAALLGPYLQSSGWNFGFTPSTGNWGAPGNLFTHSYDFGGYVSPTGEERPEFTAAQVLSRVLETLGPALATATLSHVDIPVAVASFPTSSAPSSLDLAGGGRLLALPNLSATDGTAVVCDTPVAVAADSCPLLPIDLPLNRWGADVKLALASADLVAAAPGEGALALAFAATVPVTVVIDGLQPPAVSAPRARLAIEIPAAAVPERRAVNGLDRSGRPLTITIVVLSPPDAARLTRLGPDGSTGIAPRDRAHPAPATVELTTGTSRPGAAPTIPTGVSDLPPTLESLGVYRGRGTYTAVTDLTGIDDLLLIGAADLTDVTVADLTVAGRAHGTIAAYGATERIDVRDATGPSEIRATVEIWGHANFDDARLPALALGALRGLGTVWAVTATHDLSAHWTVSGPEQWAAEPAPIRSLGGWSSTRVGHLITYRKSLKPRTHPSALHLAGLTTPVAVSVGAAEPVVVPAENPWLLLPPGTTSAAVTLTHHPSAAPVRPELLVLRPVTGWTTTIQTDQNLLRYAADGAPGDAVFTLPVTLAAGTETWLDLDVPAAPAGWLVHLSGSQLRATAWAAGECLGRVWLNDPHRAGFTGGDPGVLWIPPAWTTTGTRLTLLLRGTAGPTPPTLTGVRLGSPHGKP
ncbi:beta-galactosidase [Paractinoplanes rishiriensis]|uniref:Glycoside hydrolase 35 catalytic domain-containing protein n=1 Tax=Paractinoplanes rishiriensis TaxID=1050105 RepID=A0A919JYJ1_9ACTN|nr:beta-galactosidase [Actinoplanes rishiriensis]GIE95433.1 hypothetical protein Ari01nite_28980 [Actinoplanes rishiriensis]